MGMMYVQIVNASQGHNHQYENTKKKLYSCTAKIYFNRQFYHPLYHIL